MKTPEGQPVQRHLANTQGGTEEFPHAKLEDIIHSIATADTAWSESFDG